MAALMASISLANIYSNYMGFYSLKHLVSCAVIICWIMFTMKIISDKKLIEYHNAVSASLYSSYPMLMMFIGAYLFNFFPRIGKGFWLAGIILHIISLIVFIVIHFRHSKLEEMLPTFFVPFFGIMVSVVVGGSMNMPGLLKAITIVETSMFPFIYTLIAVSAIKHPPSGGNLYSKTIFLTPPAFCLIGYLQCFEPNFYIVLGIFTIVIGAFLYVITHLNRFFDNSFTHGKAALTFPTAVATLSFFKVSEYFNGHGNFLLYQITYQAALFLLMLSTVFVVYVLYKFYREFALDVR